MASGSPPGSPRRLYVLVGLVVVVGVVAAVLLLVHQSSPSKPVATPTTTTVPNKGQGNHTTTTLPAVSVPPAVTLTGPFTVSANRIEDASGQQYISRGFVVYCLAEPNVDCSQTGPNGITDTQRIQSAASFWHANTIRFQVAEERLFDGTGGAGDHVDSSYLGQLDSEVALANRLGMVAIITLQEERYDGPPLATTTAVAFWTVIAAHYKSNPLVMFDLYNEPRLVAQDIPASEVVTSPAFPTAGAAVQNMIWDLWKNGGTATVSGNAEASYDFVGMQKLVDTVRATGAQNVIVAEGNHGDHDLSGIVGLAEATGGSVSYVLTGANLAYGIEPDLHSGTLGPLPPTVTPAEWDEVWGQVATMVPVVMAAFQDWTPGGFCEPHAPTLIPELLSYLAQRHLGLIVWALDPGILIQHTDLSEPTTFDGVSTQPCGQSFNPDGTIGPGADILQWFTQSSGG